MSHTIVLRDRLSTNGPTLDLADLLLTKLQIWEINAKDVRDAAALLADHELVHNRSTPTVDAIDVDRIAALTGADWGLSHTLERNLGRVLATVEQMPIVEAPHDPAGQVANVLDAIARGPKSLAWRARARVGERVRWYQTPEEVRREGVSS